MFGRLFFGCDNISDEPFEIVPLVNGATFVGNIPSVARAAELLKNTSQLLCCVQTASSSGTGAGPLVIWLSPGPVLYAVPC